MGKSQVWHRIQSHLFTVNSRRLMVKSTMFAGELPMGFPGPRQDLTAELKNLDPDVQAAEGLSEVWFGGKVDVGRLVMWLNQ